MSGAVLPGAVIGILGGGQLGRMTAMAARSYGYRVQVLDPDPACPARFVVDSCVSAPFSDARAAAGLARSADVVTVEIEGIDGDSLRAAAAYAPLRPAVPVLIMIQDRISQKQWLAQHGFPVAPFCPAYDLASLSSAITQLGGRCFVKSARGGYDGRGQYIVGDVAAAPAAWAALGEQPVLVERALELRHELSVLVARRPSGECAVFPVAQNHHADRVLRYSVLPAPDSTIEPRIAERARDLGRTLAETLAVEGLLAVELFLTRDGALYINELAPRPHNTFHATERALATSQFEQHVRAICDLPLGEVSVVRPGAIVNLFGDLWLGPEPPDLARALAVPTLRLHLYEKRTPRAGRKMGHLSALGDTSEQALSRVLRAQELLGARAKEDAA
jgi:5-(carboxyamino)imidazole ribonucleotide synthase